MQQIHNNLFRSTVLFIEKGLQYCHSTIHIHTHWSKLPWKVLAQQCRVNWVSIILFRRSSSLTSGYVFTSSLELDVALSPEVPFTFHWFSRRHLCFDRSSYRPIRIEIVGPIVQENQSESSRGRVLVITKDVAVFWQIQPAAAPILNLLYFPPVT